jgi:hypothetical protein
MSDQASSVVYPVARNLGNHREDFVVEVDGVSFPTGTQRLDKVLWKTARRDSASSGPGMAGTPLRREFGFLVICCKIAA